MSTAASMNVIDQATGLRYLFGNNTAPVHVLCCPNRPSLTLPLANFLCKDLASNGQTMMWVDEIGLNDREQWPLPCPVKFDLSKSLEGHVTLDQGVNALGSSLWYGLSLHTHRIARATTPLSERLTSSGIRFDSIVVSATNGQPESFAYYGPQSNFTVISGCEIEQLQQTLNWMQQVQARTTPASWRIILAGQNEALTHALDWFEQTSKAHLSQEIHMLGTVSEDRLHAPLADAWSGLPELAEVLKRHLLKH